jgi:major type 1 subunit fimbrin (pilin)
MNKLLIASALVASLGALALAPQAAHASDGTITFNGKVTASTCTIGVNGGGASNGVTLPTVATSALNGSIGKVAAATPFSVSLSACTFGTAGNVGLYFEPGPTTQADGNLKNTATPNGVEIQLLNNTQGVMALNNAAGAQNGSTAAVTTTSTSATLNYYAQYYASAATVNAGTVTSTVTYSVIYP